MDQKQLQTLANELAKNLKIPDHLNQFDRLLKNQPKPATNTSTQKTVITGDGPLELISDRRAKTPLTAADMAAIKNALPQAGLLSFEWKIEYTLCRPALSAPGWCSTGWEF